MTPERSFKLTVMFFGLINSLTMFQIIMNEILQNLINTGEVVSFINDVIIKTEKKEGHNKVVEEVVRQLAENDLYIKLEKYKWKIREVGFLEVVIELKVIKMEKEKVQRVLDQLTLKEVKDVQKFLELVNYYWQLIKDFTVIARPFYNLVKNNQKQNWAEKQEKAFQESKERFTKELVLAVLDLDKTMRIKVNVSDYVTREVLSMECKDRRWGPVTFL